MPIKLSITLCDLSVNRNVSRCHAVLSTLRRVHFDGRIIRLSRLLIRSRFPGAARILFHGMRRVSTWSPPQNPRVPLRCVNVRYSPISFSEVQILDIPKCRCESQPIPAKRYYFSPFPLPSRPVCGRETTATIEGRREPNEAV